MNDDIGGKKQLPEVYVSETENELTDHEEDSDTDDESPPVTRDSAADDNQTIYVFPTNSKGGKRKYDKKDSCLYCKSMIGSTNLMKHLLRRHWSEEDVGQLMTLPSLSLARKKHIQILRNKGNFEYNVIVLKKRGGLLVCNRPSKRKDISENIDSYCACSNCFGFYSKREISKHQCPLKRSARPERILSSGLAYCDERSVQQFFNRLIDDKVKRVAMTDPTIVEFVKQQLDFKGFAAFSTIANKVRLLSEVLSNYRSKLCNERSLNKLSIGGSVPMENRIEAAVAREPVLFADTNLTSIGYRNLSPRNYGLLIARRLWSDEELKSQRLRPRRSGGRPPLSPNRTTSFEEALKNLAIT